jgi:hypothetical protein
MIKCQLLVASSFAAFTAFGVAAAAAQTPAVSHRHVHRAHIAAQATDAEITQTRDLNRQQLGVVGQNAGATDAQDESAAEQKAAALRTMRQHTPGMLMRTGSAAGVGRFSSGPANAHN